MTSKGVETERTNTQLNIVLLSFNLIRVAINSQMNTPKASQRKYVLNI